MYPTSPAAVPLPLRHKRLGLVIHSYWQRWHGQRATALRPRFESELAVLRHACGLGAGSFQITVRGWSADFADQMRAEAEAAAVKLEASLDLPRDAADVARFEAEVRTARRAGMSILRTWIGGRRYEDFSTRGEFDAFKARAQLGLELAEPVVRRHGSWLAAENHKDFEAPELVAMLSCLGSDRIGVCLDFGNNLALLEDPVATVETLAPLAITTHIKDLALQESAGGFRMAEVPLGEGALDLPRLLAIIERANPRVEHHLEMITRDPLEIGCRSEGYWATFPEKPRSELERALALVRATQSDTLPSMDGKTDDDILALEEENNRRCFAAAAAKLGFASSPDRR
ncbi:MAG: TIM barrel protein [Opitutaceae bacterium]|nr:TIM barrel protein [Opitutaceae bacterium]